MKETYHLVKYFDLICVCTLINGWYHIKKIIRHDKELSHYRVGGDTKFPNYNIKSKSLHDSIEEAIEAGMLEIL